MFYVNSIGNSLRTTFRLNNAGFPDSTGVMSIAGTTSMAMYVLKPSGTLLTVSGELHTDGTDGILVYETEDGDLDEEGLYRYHAKITTTSGNFYSDVSDFQVLSPL